LQVKGQANLSAARSKVWATLLDADALKGCLPGVQRFEQVGEGAWEATMTVGLAGIKGTYTGRVSITDQQPENSYRLNVEGQGGGNRIRGTGLVTLADAPEGGTTVGYDGDAQIAGTLAAVGQRLFQPAARMLADQFFKCMGSRVSTT
jgi:carbon monoxide dehydrogenase subunit G